LFKRRSGEARILERIFGEKAEIIYDRGGASILRVNESFLTYFFIGRYFARYTSEQYYVTIAVYESKQEIGDLGEARIRIKKGILGIGSKIMVRGRGLLYELVDELIRTSDMRKSILRTLYEELIIKRVDREMLEYLNGRISGSSLVVIGRTRAFYTLNPVKAWRNIVELNRLLLRSIIEKINQ